MVTAPVLAQEEADPGWSRTRARRELHESFDLWLDDVEDAMKEEPARNLMLSRGGNQVTLIARGAHLDSIKRNGLKIVTDEGEFVVRSIVKVRNRLPLAQFAILGAFALATPQSLPIPTLQSGVPGCQARLASLTFWWEKYIAS